MTLGEHEFVLNERQVRYYEDGIQHGRSVLLLHGGIGDAHLNWSHMVTSLASDYHILAPDLPGFGGSEMLKGSISLTKIVDWVVAFLDSQGIEQIAIVGVGFGALVARLLAIKHPHLIPAVVLVNGGFVPKIPPLVKFAMRLPVIGTTMTRYLANIATSDESLADMLHRPDVITPELVANVRENVDGYAQLMQMAATYPLDASEIPLVAVLIIWGIEDGSSSLSEGNKLKETISGASFIDIEECGHLPHLEEPDIFDWQIKQFLAKNDPLKRSTIPGT